MIFLVLSIASLPLTHTVYGQTAPNAMKLSTKGSIAESSNFHGAILWTAINGNTGMMIIQSPAGRGLAHVSISPSTNCSSPTATCLMSTVTDAGQIAVFKVGDTARLSIDVNSKQETVSILTGTLAGFDVTVNLSKTWSKNVTPVTSVIPIAPITTPANSTATNPVNATSSNSTVTQKTSAKHLSADLSESFQMTQH
ncbi:MAG: hypothetical protein ACHQXJ_00550 [Nitrososphaerales archaeon]